MDVERYVKDGKVAILVSPGYGAGWSTWGEDELAYDKRVVEYWLEHKDDEEFMKEIDTWADENSTIEAARKQFEEWGYHGVYFGGFKQIKLVWLPKGTLFRIKEYDGSESIETNDSVDWCVA